MKLDIITSTILEQLRLSCTQCGITSDIIDKWSFACFPESPTHVTYRARLKGTSETDSGSLVSLIEKRVSSEAGIIVTGVLMTVDSECSVAISSLGEGECQSPTTEPTTNPTTDPTTDPTSSMTTSVSAHSAASDSTDTAAIIVGGVLATVLVITVAVIVVALIVKIRCGNVSSDGEVSLHCHSGLLYYMHKCVPT